MDLSFLEGTAFGELLRQLEASPGQTLDEKIGSYAARLADVSAASKGTPFWTEHEKLRQFVETGIPRLERLSLLSSEETQLEAVAA